VGILVAGEGPEEDLAKGREHLAKGGGGGRPVVATRESFARGGEREKKRGSKKRSGRAASFSKFIWASRRTWVLVWSDPSSCLGL
jgi:hypothetical protein